MHCPATTVWTALDMWMGLLISLAAEYLHQVCFVSWWHPRGPAMTVVGV